MPHAGGYKSYTVVKEAGYAATWAEFEVEHTMCIEEVHCIADWLSARFPASRGA